MTRRVRVLLAGLSLTLLLGVLLVATLARPGTATLERDSLEALAAAAAPARRAPSYAVAGGRIEPVSEEIALTADVPGLIKAVTVEEGDLVRRGDIVVELVNDDLRAQVQAAAATVALREAELAKLMNGARPEERREAAAHLREAEANLALAQVQMERQRTLFADAVTSREVVDQTRSSLHVAEARQAHAQATAARINARPRQEDVDAARASVTLARAHLHAAQALLEKTLIRSPIDGVVLRRYRKTGEAVIINEPPTPVLEVGDTRRLRVRAEIHERDIGVLAVGQPATVTATAYPGQQFAGRVTRVGRRLGRQLIERDDPATKTDAKILEVLIDLREGVQLPVGLRVDVFIDAARR